MNFSKRCQAFALILVLSALMLAAVIPASVYAQSGTGTITLLTSAGGSTDPGPGTNTYNAGTTVSITALPGDGFVFNYWDIVSATGSYTDTNNPTSITINDGDAYAAQAIFSPIQVLPPGASFNVTSPTDAMVVVLAGVGGTTSPAPGTYALANATSTTLTATPASGWKFDHWVIGGVTGTSPHGAYSYTDTPTDNPYTVDHGYGNLYSYQPVFSPSTVPEFSSASTVILAVILIGVAFGAGAITLSSKRKNVSRISTVKL
jgi:hypothetical protein